MIAVFAVFALLVQALIPSLASAATSRPGEQVVCTSHGLTTVKLGDTAPAQAMSLACDHCVCPPAAAPPPVSAQPVVLVAYAREAAPEAAAIDLPPPARAPPRPPGQGPPTFTA